MESIIIDFWDLLRALQAFRRVSDRATMPYCCTGGDPDHSICSARLVELHSTGRGARTPQGSRPSRARLRGCDSSMIPELSTLSFRGLHTHPDSESARLPDSCIVAWKGSIVDLGEVCMVRNVSMIIREGFWVHTDDLTCVAYL